MISTGTVILFATIIFLAMIINLAAKPRFSARLTGGAVLLAAVGGMLMYGYGFSVVMDEVRAVVRTTLAVCGMFVGKNDFAVIKEVAVFQEPMVEALFWILHLLALYATASAAIATIGAGLLKRLKLWLIKRGDLVIIYGINEDSVSFARKLMAEEKVSVVFVDGSVDATGENNVNAMGGIICAGNSALNPGKRFLKSIGATRGQRKIVVYALHKDKIENIEYAAKLLGAFAAVNIDARRTTLVLQEEEEQLGLLLQAEKEKYGYGSVTVINEADMAARLLVQKYPPCDRIRFDNEACATEDFDALLIGFGRIGQAVLRQLVMNGQFAGSNFHLGVFAPDCNQVKGYLSHECRGLLEHYDIEFHAEDARGGEMFEYLRKHGDTLKYVVICTGNEKRNREIAHEIKRYLKRFGNGAGIYQCSYSGVYCAPENELPVHTRIYCPEVLCFNRIDRLAIALNNKYCGGTKDEEMKNWAECDYFSRMSSRASADFLPAYIRAVKQGSAGMVRGLTEGKALENMGRTEHLRWCAFHYVMGFETMCEETYRERARLYTEEKQRTGHSSIRIGKDMIGKQHACLVPWEELSALSAKENAITGGNVNYESMETNNVLMFLDAEG